MINIKELITCFETLKFNIKKYNMIKEDIRFYMALVNLIGCLYEINSTLPIIFINDFDEESNVVEKIS